MQVVSRSFTPKTQGEADIVDITDEVRKEVQETGIGEGTATLFVTGSTAGITVIEYEKGLLRDFQALWERVAPRDMPYAHDVADDNGHAHVRASLMGPSLVVPIAQKYLTLGTWQQIILLDFDTRPRQRQVVVQVMGQ